MHDFDAGYMVLKAVHPACAQFSLIFSVYLSYLHFIQIPGAHIFPSAPGGLTNLNLNFEHGMKN